MKEHALITSLVMNDDMRIITKMPLALQLNEPFTIIAMKKKKKASLAARVKVLGPHVQISVLQLNEMRAIISAADSVYAYWFSDNAVYSFAEFTERMGKLRAALIAYGLV